MIWAVFRRGGDVSFVVEELKAVFDPRGGAWMDGRYVPSLLAAIGDMIERHMIDIGFIPAKGATAATPRRWSSRCARWRTCPRRGRRRHRSGQHPRMPECPKCGEAALIRSEGCDQCTNCDYSKCG